MAITDQSLVVIDGDGLRVISNTRQVAIQDETGVLGVFLDDCVVYRPRGGEHRRGYGVLEEEDEEREGGAEEKEEEMESGEEEEMGRGEMGELNGNEVEEIEERDGGSIEEEEGGTDEREESWEEEEMGGGEMGELNGNVVEEREERDGGSIEEEEGGTDEREEECVSGEDEGMGGEVIGGVFGELNGRVVRPTPFEVTSISGAQCHIYDAESLSFDGIRVDGLLREPLAVTQAREGNCPASSSYAETDVDGEREREAATDLPPGGISNN